MLTLLLPPKANLAGRDWISTAAAEYFAFSFVNDYLNGDVDALYLLEKYDFYIFPVVNPDGKLRTSNISTSSPYCSEPRRETLQSSASGHH